MKAIVVGKVASIRRLREQGHGYKAIAKMLHLSSATVYKYSMGLLLSKEAELRLATRQRKRQQAFAKKYARKRRVALTKELAEFTGALLGDGCLSKYFAKSEGIYRYETAFTGGKTDFPYYETFLKPTLMKHFGFKGRLFLRKDGSTRFHIKSKKVYNFFLSLGVESGEKTVNLKIPEKIFRSNRLSLACIRGVANTDGCVYLRGKNNRLSFQLHMNAKALLAQTKKILERNGIFTTNIVKNGCNAYVLAIHRQNSVARFLKLVGFSNEHHINRLKSFNIPQYFKFFSQPTSYKMGP
jgi:intein/homing endonuclease